MLQEFITGTWPWYISGLSISAVMAMMLFFGKAFGVSSNFRTICSACGAGKKVGFFDFDWKSQVWNLYFLLGAVLGGYLVSHFMTSGAPVQISQETISDLSALGFSAPSGAQPVELFGSVAFSNPFVVLLLVVGGFLVGFGARYAGGCTSGHAISGLSDLQLPSLIAVVGFFLGGLVMTHFIFPLLFS